MKQGMFIFLFFFLLLPGCQKKIGTPTATNKPIHFSSFKKMWDNFHTVQPGVFYRSGQLSPHDLETIIKKYSIKTIINLRGRNQHRGWWRREVDVATQNNIHLYHIPMSSKHLPTKENLLTLLAIYEQAQRPILIHCYGGSDRTGEAAALWLIEQQKKDKKSALKQLSFKYGHLDFACPTKKQLIHLWQGKEWLLKDYQTQN